MGYVFGTLLIVFLIALSAVVGRRQLQNLRQLKSQEQLPLEDRRYFRWQCYRRLFGCVLQLAIAGLLIGLLYGGYVKELDRLIERSDRATEERLPLSEEEKDVYVAALVMAYWIVGLSMLWIIVAILELGAIRRYGMRHRQRIRNDREDMLQRQLPLIRRSRNGHQ